MKKQILSEQFRRMQKLAGIITENLVSETENPNIIKVNAKVNNKETKVSIDQDNFPKKVTIEWERDRDDMSNRPVRSKQDDELGSNSNYTKYWLKDHAEELDFESGDLLDDHGSEGKVMLFTATSRDKMWDFEVEVQVTFNYEDSGIIDDIDWETLEITQGQSRSPLSNVSQLTSEPEDTDDTYDDDDTYDYLVIIGSGYLDIENNFGGRPPMTNSELAKIGQEYVKEKYGEVTDGNIKKTLDFIYKKINENLNNIDWRTLEITSKDNDSMEEGTCGYSQTVDGKKLNTPGGTRGMSALNRTNSMGGSYNTDRYKY